MELSNYIASLLLKNNCVIVPNFGGFITNYQPAVINKVSHSIMPPTKTMLFNSALKSNDGLLANFVANKLNQTYSNSISLIEKEANAWHLKLKKGERIQIGEAGFLYLKNQTIQFEQNREFNLLLNAFGLSAVNFIPSTKLNKTKISNSVSIVFDKSIEKASDTVKQKNQVQEQPSKIVVLKPQKSKNKFWKYAAVACLIPALFYSYWIPMNTNYLETGNIQTSDFNPFKKPINKNYTKRLMHKVNVLEFEKHQSIKNITKTIASDVKYYNYQFNEELYIPVELSKEGKSDVEIKTNKIAKSKIISNSLANIYLIAGCFSNKNNAESYVNTLKNQGFNAKVIDKNKGLYRVSAESFYSKDEAKKMKKSLKEKSISTWILVK